jgi:hypothetical protein
MLAAGQRAAHPKRYCGGKCRDHRQGEPQTKAM